jgi:predicted transcriptional regulator
MVFDISNLKKIRKQLDITQHNFAKKAGVSQSLIAKIEAGKLDPTYSKVKKIESALEILTKHEQKEAKDIMARRIISVNYNTKINQVIKLMTQNNISQVPVLDNSHVVGLISESTILTKNPDEIQNLIAEDIQDYPPPIISINTKIDLIKSLLKYYPLVLVKEKGKLVGLITKSDLIKSLI